MNKAVKTWTQFVKHYKPIQNTVTEGAPFGGTMFETFGKDKEFLQTQNPKCIWTFICEGNSEIISSGVWLANRIGYFVTEVPFEGERGSVEFSLK
jgi:inhibitor of KinA sporulation pathway (predicted exonuclease)